VMITGSEALKAARTIREYCNEKSDSNSNCKGCPFYFSGSVCGVEDVPTEWALPHDVQDNSAESVEEPPDNVNHPAHYCMGRIETIEAIEVALGADGFRAYCAGNVLKYVWRYRYKGGVEDLQKARWYLDRLIGLVEGGGDG